MGVAVTSSSRCRTSSWPTSCARGVGLDSPAWSARDRAGVGGICSALDVLPFVPDSVVRAGEKILGRKFPRHYLERSHTAWVRPEFVTQYRLRERDLEVLESLRAETLAHTESMLYLTMPVWGWGGSFMRGSLLQEGVEVRSPLLDLRIVEFALRRPVAERADGTETKLLLRSAMKGLLPEPVLAPRTHRTGVTVGFSTQRMRQAYPGLIAQLFAEPLRLAELGVVDPAVLRSAADRYLAGDGGDFLRVNLFHTMKVELWLRGLERRDNDATCNPGRIFPGGDVSCGMRS